MCTVKIKWENPWLQQTTDFIIHDPIYYVTNFFMTKFFIYFRNNAHKIIARLLLFTTVTSFMDIRVITIISKAWLINHGHIYICVAKCKKNRLALHIRKLFCEFFCYLRFKNVFMTMKSNRILSLLCLRNSAYNETRL